MPELKDLIERQVNEDKERLQEQRHGEHSNLLAGLLVAIEDLSEKLPTKIEVQPPVVNVAPAEISVNPPEINVDSNIAWPDEPAFKVTNIDDAKISTEQMESLLTEISRKLTETSGDLRKLTEKETIIEAPVINLPETKIEVPVDRFIEALPKELDLTGLEDRLDRLSALMEELNLREYPEFEYEPLSSGIDQVKQAIKDIVFPIPPGSTPAFRDSTGAPTSAVVDGSGILPTTSASYALKLTKSGVYVYIAKAPVGSSTSSAVWQVKRLDKTSGLLITWADGNSNFDNVATDLTALTYS